MMLAGPLGSRIVGLAARADEPLARSMAASADGAVARS
jgi:hypothetical protein